MLFFSKILKKSEKSRTIANCNRSTSSKNSVDKRMKQSDTKIYVPSISSMECIAGILK